MSIERFLQMFFLVIFAIALVYIIALIVSITYNFKKNNEKKDKGYYRVIVGLTMFGVIVIVLFKTLLTGIV